MPPILRVLQPGEAKPAPYVIAIVANPALERLRGSGAFVRDPILGRQADFDAAAGYVLRSLFGRLPGQRERLLAGAGLGARIRVVSLFPDPDTPADAATALCAEDAESNLLVARRTAFTPFLARFGVTADVAFAVSASPTHDRASAWYTTDDRARGGIGFVLDGQPYTHWYHCAIPGTVALPVTSTSLTAVHEFGHAASSYSDGGITDLYVQAPPGFNVRQGRPIPPQFAVYDGHTYGSDPTRDGLGYPPGWTTYHAALRNPHAPAVMDNYWKAPSGVPLDCEHDEITQAFLRDRLLAKLSR